MFTLSVTAKENKTVKMPLGTGTTFSDNDFRATISFSSDANGNYTLEENFINSSDSTKVCNQTFVFLDKDGKTVEQKGITITAAANKETTIRDSSIISLKSKYESSHYYVIYEVTSEVSTITEPNLEEFKNESEAFSCYARKILMTVDILETNEVVVSEKAEIIFSQSLKGVNRTFIDGTKSKIPNIPPLGKLQIKSFLRDGKEEYYKLHKKDGKYIYESGITADLLGLHTFDLQYKQSFGVDKNSGLDKVYISLGNGWNIPVEEFQLVINYPKDYKEVNPATIYINKKQVPINITNRKIEANFHYLKATDNIVFSHDLSDGYFVAANDEAFSLPVIFGTIVAVCTAVYIFFTGCRKDYYSKNEFSSFDIPSLYAYETEYIYNATTVNGLSVLLLQLINEGYVKLELSPITDDDCLLTKIKEYDGDNAVIKEYFDTLFGKEKETDIDEFRENYTKRKSGAINQAVKSDSNINETFVKTYQKKRFFKSCLCLSFFCLLAFIPIAVNCFNPAKILVMLALSAALAPVNCFALDADFGSKIKRFLLLFVSCAISLFVSISISLMGTNIKNLYVLGPQISVILIFYIILFVGSIISTRSFERTKRGEDNFDKIISFKQFISSITNSQAEAVLNVCPDYFYQCYPYLFALCTETERIHFIEAFKGINLSSNKYPMFNRSEDFDLFMKKIIFKIQSFISAANKSKGR